MTGFGPIVETLQGKPIYQLESGHFQTPITLSFHGETIPNL